MSSISSSTSPDYADYSNGLWTQAQQTQDAEWNALGQTMGNLDQEQEKVNQQTEATINEGSNGE